MFRSSAYGCFVESDIDLMLAPSHVRRAADVVLQRADGAYDGGWAPGESDVLLRHRDEAKGQAVHAARTPEGFRLRFEGHCEFDLSPALDRIGWRVAPAAAPGLVAILAAGALMTFRFMLAGDLVLHCSAVSVAGRGLAFVGRSGMGKSTMAALMCAAGAAMVTDDVGRVVLDAGTVCMATGGNESRLRESAHYIADRMPNWSMRDTTDGRLAVSLPRWPGETVPLEAITIPVPVPGGDRLDLRRLGAREAVIALSAFPRLPGLVSRQHLAHQFTRAADLAGRVPVFVASVPWSETGSRSTASELADALGWVVPGPVGLGLGVSR